MSCGLLSSILNAFKPISLHPGRERPPACYQHVVQTGALVGQEDELVHLLSRAADTA